MSCVSHEKIKRKRRKVTMKFKLICCEVFMRLACLAIADAPHTIDPEFTKLGAHEAPDRMRELIQKKIDEIDEASGYDAILLGYGLCGNATSGIKAKSVPLVIPRAHDCCTIFLGSKEKFAENFKDDLSSRWSSVGYMEREGTYLRETDTGKLLGLDKDYDQLVEQYGEENAQYIWETLHPQSHSDQLIFIDIPEISHLGHLEQFKAMAREQGKDVRVIDGDVRLVRELLNGNWNEDEYLIVPPGKEIKAVYDLEKIVETL
jgi:hypothetical protein